MDQQSCESAINQAQDFKKWCISDIPEQLQQEGNEANNENYMKKKEFIFYWDIIIRL